MPEGDCCFLASLREGMPGGIGKNAAYPLYVRVSGGETERTSRERKRRGNEMSDCERVGKKAFHPEGKGRGRIISTSSMKGERKRTFHDSR